MRSSFRRFSIFAILLVPFVLTGCESARKVIGNTKDAPDEFAVYQRPPLSLPPEFALRPPVPGSVRTGGITPTDQARAALLRRQASVRQEAPIDPNLSDGLNALMRDTGALTADASIRDVVDSETSLLVREDQRLADKMIFWVDDKPFEGTVVDAQKEQQRIRENQALGRPLTEGETVQVRRKRDRKGLFEF
jgi:hypothetical protein